MDDTKIAELDSWYARRIKSECMGEDSEINHKEADILLLRLLTELGCPKTVEAFTKVGRWYA